MKSNLSYRNYEEYKLCKVCNIFILKYWSKCLFSETKFKIYDPLKFIFKLTSSKINQMQRIK